MKNLTLALAALTLLLSPLQSAQEDGPVRILFLGHEATHHPSNEYYPMIAKALGRDGIYFDYTTSVEEALGDYKYLSQFDGLLLYANHDTIKDHQMDNLLKYVHEGNGFIPVHSASFCFRNKMQFVKLVGGQFKHHKGKEFTTKIVKPDHPALEGFKEFKAWDETYVHAHGGKDREILMVREPEGDDDNIKEPEPWTWTRTHGEGRVFYTASGHDQRVWSQPEFHQLIKSGILWAIGDTRKKSYTEFIAARPPLKYEKRDNIPNYERRPEPLPYQLPLSPEDSLKYTQAPVGWKLELFASEPDIINPIGLAWDEQGRLWAAETVDYPNEIKAERKGDDKIKILQDTDGDGKCDKVTVFADGLNIPTSLTFSNGGVLVHHAAETLFLKDTDGDDKADVREVVLSGWGTGDTHAGPSNLRYGLDNQIWGTVGYSAFNHDANRFGSGVYRFTKDGSKIEFLHQFNNNTWGLGFNNAGDVFGSTANNNPSFFCGIPATAMPGGKRQGTARMIATTPRFYPITPNIRQVDAFNAYTAGAGHGFANSADFPYRWRGIMAFVAGPTGNLLGKFRMIRDGAGFKAKNEFNLVASADEWFSPVAAEVGPDGALWIADWYNFIIQHNPTPSSGRGGYDAKNGKGNAHVNPNRDRQHGRIYRLVWDKSWEPTTKSLQEASSEQLVAALGDSNQFWRLTAQRLLVDGKKTDAVEALQTLVKPRPKINVGFGVIASPRAVAADSEEAPVFTLADSDLYHGDPWLMLPPLGLREGSSIHALWTLHGLGKLDVDTHRAALLSVDPALRRNAIRALPLDEKGIALMFESAVINDPDLTTRLAAFVALAQFPTSDAVKNAVAALGNDPTNRKDPWLSAALAAASTSHGVKSLADANFKPSDVNLLADADWKPRTYSGKGAIHTKPKDEGVGGSDCLKIVSKTGTDTSFYTSAKLKPNARYRLSAKVKTENVAGGGMGALLNVHEMQNPRVVTKALKKQNGWTEVSVDFDADGRDLVTVNTLFGGWGQSTGTAWWDEIKLNELVAEKTEAATAKLEPGDAARGKEIFTTHEVAACSRCHAVAGEGGVIGPKLDTLATRKGADYIRRSLLEPNADIAEDYPLEVSPMPPMNLLLGPQEIEDILAYLQTLK